MRGSLAILCLFVVSSVGLADPPPPSIALAWQDIRLGDVLNEDTKASDFHKEGAVHVSLANMKVVSRVSGLRIAEGALWIQSVSAQLSYGRISAKNVAILEVPTFLGGRKTVETQLVTLNNAGVSAAKVGDKPWSIPLPEEIELDYLRAANGETSLAFKDPKAVIAGLHRSIDDGFSDAFLDRSARVDGVNLPGVIEFLVKQKKGDLFGAVRASLKREVERPEFLRGIEVAISKQLPVLPIALGGKLSGVWRLKANADGMMSVSFGSKSAEALLAKKEPGEKFIAVANDAGMDLIVGLLMDTLARFPGEKLGKGFRIASGLMSYVPQTDDERMQLAMIASELVDATVDPKDMASLAIDLKGDRLKREIHLIDGKDHPLLQLRLGIVVSVTGAEDVTVPVTWEFSTGQGGNLVLDRIAVEKNSRDLNPGFALFQKLEGSLKANLARFLLNEKLSQFQRENAGAKAKFSIGKLSDTEHGLRLSIQE